MIEIKDNYKHIYEVNVDVFNLVGKQLKTVSKTTTLSTSDLAKGIYTIRINGALTQKLIIE